MEIAGCDRLPTAYGRLKGQVYIGISGGHLPKIAIYTNEYAQNKRPLIRAKAEVIPLSSTVRTPCAPAGKLILWQENLRPRLAAPQCISSGSRTADRGTAAMYSQRHEMFLSPSLLPGPACYKVRHRFQEFRIPVSAIAEPRRHLRQ